jgi:hypothetical protein
VVPGDAGKREGAVRIAAEYITGVHVVVGPYDLVCGDPANAADWFSGAASVSLFASSRPASDFPSFLRSLTEPKEASR